MTKNGNRAYVEEVTRRLIAEGENVNTGQAVNHILRVQIIQIEQMADLSEQIRQVTEYQIKYPSITWLAITHPFKLSVVILAIIVVFAVLFFPEAAQVWGEILRKALGL